VIPKGEVTYNNMYYGTKEYKNDGIKAAFGIAGRILGGGGLALIYLANKNKKKALAKTVSLGHQRIIFPQHNTSILITQFALSFKILV
jgi:hypothetical protein